MDNKKQLDSILAMDDSLAMVESITDGLPVDDYSPEQDKDITLDDIFGVNANDTPQTFGDQFASLGEDTKTEDGQRMITDAFVSEINKLPGTTVEISDIPQLAAIVHGGTIPDVGHALQLLPGDMSQHGISTIVRQEQFRGNLTDVGRGKTQYPPVAETVHYLALQHKRPAHAVHRIDHPAGSDETTDDGGTHWCILAQVLRRLDQ